MSSVPDPVTPREGGVSRRQFLRVVTTTTLGAVAFTGCKPPAEEMAAQSRVLLAEDMLSAYEDWYATACQGCEAGCGVIVRIVEGRAKKVEGTPDHPVNRGKLCARGQALVQEQYHPDRIQGPLVRSGPRGSGAFVPIAWDEAVDRLSARLRDLTAQGRGGAVALLTRPLAAHRALVVQGFAGALGARRLTLDPLPQAPVREAVRRVFGTDRLPELDIANARYVLSFGADFLSTWLSPVHYGVDYGIFRQGSYDIEAFEPRTATGRPRGYLVQVEPRFSTTAASADTWVPVRPGSEGLLARALARVMVAEGLVDAGAAEAFGGEAALEAYRPELVAERVGVPAERIVQLARDFATRRPSLALGGGPAAAHTNGTEMLADVYALNVLVGNVGRPGGVLLNPPPPLDGLPTEDAASPLADWRAFAGDLAAGRVDTVLVHEANPAYGLPNALDVRDALAGAPFVASFSSFMDETTALADLILPSHLPLEDWGDSVPTPAPGVPVLTIQQPVVPPTFDTRSFGDVLMVLLGRLGGPVGAAVPWGTMRDAVRDGARALHRRLGGSGDGADFERFWVQLLQRGGWWAAEPPVPSVAPPGAGPGVGAAGSTLGAAPTEATEPRFGGDEAGYHFALVPFSHNTLGDGRMAHLPWLQAAPDPVTSVVWRNWVELNPRIAARLGVKEGDLVTIETPAGRAELPVYVNPAAPPDVLGIPMGWGHNGYGRWADGRGVNPLDLLVPLVDEATGSLAYAATRARVTPVGRRVDLPKFEGTVPAYQITGAEVLKVTGDA